MYFDNTGNSCNKIWINKILNLTSCKLYYAHTYKFVKLVKSQNELYSIVSTLLTEISLKKQQIQIWLNLFQDFIHVIRHKIYFSIANSVNSLHIIKNITLNKFASSLMYIPGKLKE